MNVSCYVVIGIVLGIWMIAEAWLGANGENDDSED